MAIDTLFGQSFHFAYLSGWSLLVESFVPKHFFVEALHVSRRG